MEERRACWQYPMRGNRHERRKNLSLVTKKSNAGSKVRTAVIGKFMLRASEGKGAITSKMAAKGKPGGQQEEKRGRKGKEIGGGL